MHENIGFVIRHFLAYAPFYAKCVWKRFRAPCCISADFRVTSYLTMCQGQLWMQPLKCQAKIILKSNRGTTTSRGFNDGSLQQNIVLFKLSWNFEGVAYFMSFSSIFLISDNFCMYNKPNVNCWLSDGIWFTHFDVSKKYIISHKCIVCRR